MGILDLFKRKTKNTFPENELERTLMRAATEASAKGELYQKLMWNELFVLTPAEQQGPEETEAGNSKLRLVHFEDGVIPVFSSLNRIFDKGIVTHEVAYASLKGQDLFAAAKGATWILNPYSDYGKELIPEEVERMMNGTIYDLLDEQEAERGKMEQFNSLFEQAQEKQKGLLLLDGYKRKKLNKAQSAKLEESVSCFKACLELAPEHWQSMFLLAKTLQRLERHSEAFEYLERAFSIELNNHFIPLEASLEAMHLKDLEKALFYSAEALTRKPNDVALLGNHAMNLLVAGKDQVAKDVINEALSIQPDDAVNRNVQSIVQAVASGKQKRPTFEDVVK